MKLNPDCVRDILLDVESKTSFSKSADYLGPDDFGKLKERYPYEEVMYHIKQCEYAGLILKTEFFMDGGCIVTDLSPLGHEFLADIRKDTNWNKTKEVAKTVGSYSLKSLTDIASQVVTNLIASQFNS